VLQAWRSSARSGLAPPPDTLAERRARRPLTALLHLVQPVARLRGRLRHGLTPWRRRGPGRFAAPAARGLWIWCEQWTEPERRLETIEQELRAGGAAVWRGGVFDRWDLELRGGLFGSARLRMAAEDHAGGRQLVRLRAWPRCGAVAAIVAATLAIVAVAALESGAALVGGVLGSTAAALMVAIVADCAWAMGGMKRALDRMRREWR
jgi:hypothetical protein